MTAAHHRKLPDRCNPPDHWALVCGRSPPNDFGFRTERLQVIYNNASDPWRDEAPHLHRESDEVYIVQEGVMVLMVEEAIIRVSAGEVLCVPAGTLHQLVDVVAPVTSLVIRSPSVDDKIVYTSDVLARGWNDNVSGAA